MECDYITMHAELIYTVLQQMRTFSYKCCKYFYYSDEKLVLSNMYQLKENAVTKRQHNLTQNKSKLGIMQFNDILIDADNEGSLKKGAAEVVSRLRPEWGNREGFKFKIFSDGITNKLIGVYIEGKNNSNKYSAHSKY